MTENSKPIIVTGMHRSGTSLTASLLSALGVDMGQNLLPADKSNPRGYFEDIDFLEFQRGILLKSSPSNDGGHPDWGWTEHEKLNRKNFKRFIPRAKELLAKNDNRQGYWGWKDPRTTLLLDFWDSLLKDPCYVFVYRFPWDVADSMQRLGSTVFVSNPEYAYRIWHFYNRHLCDFFIKNQQRCLLLSINALQKDPNQLVENLYRKFNLEIDTARISEIYEKTLFTSIEGSDPLIDGIAAALPHCAKLLEELDNLADLSGAKLWRARPLLSDHQANNKTSEHKQVDLSVIIPCFDDGQFLIESIASFERFSPKNCELIIVNDGSKEPRTLEILKTFRDAGYFIIDQDNQGLSEARNSGIRAAAGQFILPLDADNRMRAGFIEQAIEIFNSSPEVGIIYGDRQFFGMKTDVDKVAGFDLEELLTFNYIDAGAIFRKQVWTDCCGYDQKMSPLEDWDLWIGAAGCGWHFHRLSRLTFDYRVRPASLLSMVEDADFLEQLLESMMLKHYELYQSRFVKQLAKMKRSSAHLTVSVRNLTEENKLLKKELSKSDISKPPFDAIENTGIRLIMNYVRRSRQKLSEFIKLRKNRFKNKS